VQTRTISKPGEVFWDEDVALKGFFGNTYSGKTRFYSTIIFTDYTNLQVRFICNELKHFWYTEARIAFYISTKNRGFNSISQVAPHIQTLRELGVDLNKMGFLKNDLTCKI
jgi:hypothetical protein